MRKSYRTRMIAWIIAAIIVFCALPVTSMAAIANKPNYGGLFVVNRYANCYVEYVDEDGKFHSDLSGSIQGKQFTMTIRVSENADIAFLSQQSVMYYVLPDKVDNITEISGTNVTGEVTSDNMIKFTWTGEKQSNFQAVVKFGTAQNVYDLYNIANINGTYYRLAKTTIRTDKELSKNLGKKLADSDYTMPEYDFESLKITVKDKEYSYLCDKNAEEIAKTGRYYTADFVDLDVVPNKIGAMDGTNPRWLVPESQRYGDKNNTDSYHANYSITLFEDPYEQDLHNLLKVGDNYYRLRKSRIVAKDPDNYKNAAIVSEKDYQIVSNADYDFSGVFLEIDGETYRYSDHELTSAEKKDGFESYYTVKFDHVVKQNRINGDDDWYNNDEGWLDGSKAQYGAEGNDITSYHRNYIGTLHKGTRSAQTKKVLITSNWPEGKPAFRGTEIILTAELTGFKEGSYTLQWEYSTDTKNWIELTGETGMTLTYTLDDETATYYWRVVAYDKE